MSGAHVHHELAPLAAERGFLARREPRARILAVVALIAGVVLVAREDWPRFAALGIGALALAALAGPPMPLVVLRALVVVPFALLAAVFLPFQSGGHELFGVTIAFASVRVTEEGVRALIDLVARAVVSAVAIAALGAASDDADLARGLEGLRVPRLIVVTVSFTLRYVRTLAEEARRMSLARELREFRRPSALRALVSLGRSIGTLFVRTYERAEHIHAAMVARGFRGKMPSLNARALGLADVALVLACVAWAALVHVLPLERLA